MFSLGNKMENKLVRRTAIFSTALLTLFLSAPVFAQYVWIDANNVRHYSDKAPPSSIPDSRILKTPQSSGKTGVSYETVTKAPESKDEAPHAAAPRTPQTLADMNAGYQKRKMEQAEKDKKAEQEAKAAEDRAKTCETARIHQKTLESGIRVGQTDKNGNRSILNDEERARELQEVRRIIDKCK